MRKIAFAAIAAFIVALWVGAAFVAVKSFFQPVGRSRTNQLQVSLPKGDCPQSLAVFNFRANGDPDAKYYAAAFARALADRTYCAPTHITQQMSVDEIGGAICRAGEDPTSPVSDELAVKLGKKMAVAYVVTGDMTVSGGKVDVSVYVTDTAHPGSKKAYTASGALADLSSMQSKLAPLVVAAMKISPDPSSSVELKRPNFSKSETLKLYGLSFFSEPKECESLRWKILEADPHSSFAFARLLDFYKCGPSTCAELRNNKRLAQFLAGSLPEFSDNSQIAVLYGLLLAKQGKYQQAESILKDALKKDPDMNRAHTALAYVARLRQNGDLAVEESLKAVKAWPNNPYLHATLANSYSQAASNARHGDYFTRMSKAARKKWEANTHKSLEEAWISVKLDRDCSQGWFSVLNNSRELSRHRDIETAYKELQRIDPTNVEVYTSYAFCFSPQWGGTDTKQEEIFVQAAKAFPQGSHKPLLVCALSLSSNATDKGRVGGPYAGEVLRLADKISKMAGDQSEDAIVVKTQAYELTRRRADFLRVVESGYQKIGGPTWQYRYGMACAFAYEDKGDPAYLKKAADLFSDYCREVPYDPRGYVQTGWCLSHLGKRAEAKAQFLKALKLHPTNKSALDKLKYVQ